METEFTYEDGKLIGHIENSRSLTQIGLVKEDLVRILKKMGYNDLVLELNLKNVEDLLQREKHAYSEAAAKVSLEKKSEEAPVEEKKFNKQNQFIEIKDLKDCNLSRVHTEGEIFNIAETKTKTD